MFAALLLGWRDPKPATNNGDAIVNNRIDKLVQLLAFPYSGPYLGAFYRLVE